MATKAARVRTFTTSVDIPADKRAKVVGILNQHLADAFDLQSQVKQAHWNVKGPDFWQLHKLFDEVAERAAEWVDELAERVTALGGYATGTVRMAAGDEHAARVPDRHHRRHGLRPGGGEAAGGVHQLGPRGDRRDRQARRRQHGGPVHRDQPLRGQVPLLPRGAPPGLAQRAANRGQRSTQAGRQAGSSPFASSRAASARAVICSIVSPSARAAMPTLIPTPVSACSERSNS